MANSPGVALRVDLLPSPAIGCLLACVHLGAALGALALPGSPWSTSVAWGMLAFGASRSLARHAFRRGAEAVVGIAHSDSEGWRLTTARGERIGGCTATSAFVHPRLCIVSYSTPRGRIDVLVPKGAVTPDEARRLRVALRQIALRSTSAQGGARPSGIASFLRLPSLAASFRRIRVRGRQSVKFNAPVRSRDAVERPLPSPRSADAG